VIPVLSILARWERMRRRKGLPPVPHDMWRRAREMGRI
jgi:hypothetical protein